MSRIGRKPIPLPKGVAVKIEGNVVAVQGPKGKLDTQLPRGIRVEQQDGNLVAIRENDSQAAVHGLARALVNNAVEGVTKGWTRELEIVGIGYRCDLKGRIALSEELSLWYLGHLFHLGVSGMPESGVDETHSRMQAAARAGRVTYA